MQRRFLVLTAAVAALGMATALTSCGGSSGSDTVTLRMVAAEYDMTGGGDTQEFESQNPGIDVEVELRPWADVDRRITELVEAGEAPDIAQTAAFTDYAADDELYTADQLLSIPVQSDLLGPLNEGGKAERVQYALPFVASTRLLLYNQDLFAKAGITEDPRTWDELRIDAQQLKLGTDALYPIALPLGPEEAHAEALIWLLSGGGGYLDGAGTYSIGSQQNIETLAWIKDKLVNAGLTGPVLPSALDRKEAFAAFTRGEVGMLTGPPSLQQAAEKAGVNVGTVAMPGKDGKSGSALGVADWLMAFKQGGHRAEISTFLDFVYSDENVLEFADRNGLLPVTISASEVMRKNPRQASLLEFLDELPNAVLPPVGKPSWRKVSENIRNTIGSALDPDGRPAAVLGEISREALATEGGP